MAERKPSYAELLRRLEEAEAVIQALRDGRVDAVVSNESVALLCLARTEEQLRSTQQRLRVALEASGGVVYERARESADSTYRGDDWTRIIGYSPEEIPPRDKLKAWFFEQVHPEDRRSVAQASQEFATGKTGRYDIEARLRHKDGRWVWVRDVAQAIERDDRGRVQHYVGVMFDITERKRVEDLLLQLSESLEERVVERTAEVQRQAEKLRALAMELSQAEQLERKRLAQVLHDHVQQLIVAARMQIGWLKQGSEPERVWAAAQAVDALLRETLEVSRSLTVELSPPVLHEAGLIGGLNWLASRMKEKNGFTVNLRSDNKAEPATEGMRFLLFECARELLFNAMKHSGVKEADVVVVRTKDDLIRLVVSDDGGGFDPELLERRTSEYETFGLFSIEQRLSHIGGRMEIVTAPGKGTRITLTAPAGGTSR